MAIKDMKGTISTTGMVNQRPPRIQAPDMSKMKMPTNRTVNTPREVVKKPVEQPKQSNLIDKIQNLTDQDKAVLGTVLSPSVSKVLAKVAPDIQPLLNQFTKEEENVVLPVSLVKNFASRKYGGNEQQSVQSFVADLAGQMEQTTVPPDTQIADSPDSGVDFNSIDSDVMPA
jgi:hypothetical protein